MNYDKYQYLRVEVDADGICTVTMNRPEVLNAAGGPMHPELERIWLDLNEDPRIKAVVFTGAGRAFSAGGDLKGMAQRVATPENFRHTLKAGEHATPVGEHAGTRVASHRGHQRRRDGGLAARWRCSATEMLTMNSNDHASAVKAFAKKRKPEFKGD